MWEGLFRAGAGWKRTPLSDRLHMINDSFMSRANTIVVPGGKMELAMQLIFTPFIWRLMDRRRKALAQ